MLVNLSPRFHITGQMVWFNIISYCWNLIKAPLTPSISPGFMVRLAEGGAVYHGTRAEVLGLIFSGHAFSSATRNNSHLPCLLSTHMARARGHDSHAGGGMLNYSIRGPLVPSTSPGFSSRTGRGGSSIMVSEPGGLEFETRSRIFLLCVIPTYRSLYGKARAAQWRWSLGWHVVWGILESDKRPPHPFYIT
jgi:hypothetical protein